MIAKDIWERQKGETGRAFQAFCIFRDLGPGRTVAETSRKLQKNYQTLKEWKAKYNWVERAEAYDAYVDKKATEKAVKDLAKMKERHIKIAMQMQTAALEGLEAIDPSKITAADITRMMESGIKLERLTRGESTENQKITGNVEHEHEGTVKLEGEIDFSTFTDEELEQFGRLLEKAEG